MNEELKSAKRKIFISQPINGKTDEEVLNRRQFLKEGILRSMFPDYELIDSWITEEPPNGLNAGLWYLGESIKILAQADLAVFDEGWENAKGCVIEQIAAEEYGVKCLYFARIDETFIFK